MTTCTSKKVSSNIDEIIKFLEEMKENGYKTVELIDNTRGMGWKSENPTIEFLFNNCKEPTVVGIEARK